MKNKIVIISFAVVLIGLALVNLFIPATDISLSERRHLKQLPQFSLEKIFNGEYMEDFDGYAVDQFLLREQFRALKAAFDRLVYGKLDTNGLYSRYGHLFKVEYPLKENKVLQMAKKLLAVQEKYLEGKNVYYSIVPDKNYYLPKSYKNLALDYDRLAQLMHENLSGKMTYIDLFGTLTLDDYYTTDSHWRQERLQNVVRTLGAGLKANIMYDFSGYTQRSYAPFYGVYYGQSARSFKPDTLIWLENEILLDAVVTSADPSTPLVIYNTDRLSGMDCYEMFLSGAQPILTLKNPHNTSGKSLIIFRDSFGSSLAPLLLDGYSTITLIDLRYAKSPILAEYVNFDEFQDVLFIYSTTIINNSDMID